jgi:outer membrane lipoprotein-sorting protein
MTDRELDRMMQHVLLDAIKCDCEKELDDIPAFKPTNNYQRQMAAMLSDPLKWARNRARPIWKSALQKVAMILLLFSLSLGGLMAVNPTARAAVVRWVTEWYEDHLVYRYSGEQISGEMLQYEITDLPEGYTEDERVNWPSYVSVVYRNKNNNKTIYFDCTYMQQGSATDYVTEGVEVIPVVVNGFSGQLFLTDDRENKWNTITWIDTERNLQFEIDANVGQDVILHMAESVSLAKTENQKKYQN